MSTAAPKGSIVVADRDAFASSTTLGNSRIETRVVSFCSVVQFSTLPSLKKVSFGTSIIQRSRRIALDPNLLETLKLKEGDKVRVELDVDSETILIRRAVAVPQKRSRDGEQSRA